MKDLITTIGSVTILMVFVLQFCFNQVTMTRILVGDKILENYEEQYKIEGVESDWDFCKTQLIKCFDVEEKDIKVEEAQNQKIVKIPIKNVIACGDFLGINSTENQAIYCGVVNVYEEPNNNYGDSNIDDDA
ncbi:MAG: hypothetical protein IKU53_03555 [Firmicutes bacterium]|nr:hypothetical protein [Bacillota bacterium]